jgi:hypothetical protein
MREPDFVTCNPLACNAGAVRTAGTGWLAIAVLAAYLMVSARPSFGQAYASSLSGIVTDAQGSAIPGASLTLTNTGNNQVRHAATASDGRYLFSQLLPGTYTLQVRARGFKMAVHSGVTLLAYRAASLNVQMEVGTLQQTVQVTSHAPLLDTRSANQSSTLTERMIASLPTFINNPLSLVLTQAGATQGVNGQLNSTLDQNYSAFDLNGGRSMSSEILLDGTSDKAADWGGLLVAPPTGTVQEMQIQSNTYDAQYGRSGGGVLSIVTKGGTNQFHGDAYEFLQSQALNATTWSNNAFVDPGCSTTACDRLKKPVYTLNQFGGDFGGPLWKGKRVYFFVGYDGLRERTPNSFGPYTVPTMAQRNGDFSATYNPDGTLQTLYNPFTTTLSSAGQYIRQPFDAACAGVVYPNTCSGNVIPTSMINPVSAKVMALFPQPTSSGAPITNANNYYKTGSGNDVNDHIDARIDWAHTDKHTMFVRWTQRIRENQSPPCFYCDGADESGPYINPGYQVVWSNTITPSPNWAITALISSGRWSEDQVNPAQGILTPASVGLNNAQYQAPIVPSFTIDGYAPLGEQFSQRIQTYIRYTDLLQVNANWQKSAHSIEFGGLLEPDLINNFDEFSGAFEFGNGFTSGPFAATSSTTTGNSLASLLLGTSSFGQSTSQPAVASALPYYGLYAQDTWQATRKLTATFGLRYEVQTGATERFNRLAAFDPNVVNPISSQIGTTVHGGMVFATPWNRDAWPTDWNNWAPRVGLAYRITNKLVARSGFGIFFAPASSLYTFDYPGEYAGYSGDTVMASSVGGGGLVPLNLVNNPFPTGLTPITGSSQGLLTFLGQSPFQTWLTGPHPTGYKMNWSFDLQYELHPGTVLDVGYLGFGARKLVFGNPNLDINQLPTRYLSLGTKLDQQVSNPFATVITTGPLSGPTIPYYQTLLPYPEFDSIQPTRSLPGATANYNALNIQFTHEFSSGLSLIASYQWSKLLDDASEDQGWAVSQDQWRDYYNRELDYSISTHNVPQNFVTSLVYNLPVGRGRHFGSGMPKLADSLVGGWQVSGIVTLQSGYPIFIGAPGTLGTYGFGRQAFNLVSSSALYYPGFRQTPERWFNTCTLLLDGERTGCMSANEPVAWEEPGPYTIGNAPRLLSNLRTGATRNADLSLAKVFDIAERYRLQFRGEFLNTFNTPTFAGEGAGSTVTSSTFGQMSYTGNGPRTIQFSLKLQF